MAERHPMANFVYSSADLDHPLCDVLGGPGLTLGSFGLDSNKYCVVANVDFDAVEKRLQINDVIVKKYGFANVKEFMDCYCRCHFWNCYDIYSRNKDKGKETLREFLMFYHDKAARFHPNDNIPIPPDDGNMLDYLKSYDPNWLLSVGW